MSRIFGRKTFLKILHNSRGDTIVEVLIAVAVVSLVLVSAYALTNRNVASMQATQEQIYAQKLVQQQIEYFRANPAIATADGCYTAPTTYTTGAGCNTTNGGATYALAVKATGTTCTSAAIQAKWETVTGTNANITVCYEAAT